MNLPSSSTQSWLLRQRSIPARIAAWRAVESFALRISKAYFALHFFLPTLRGHSFGYFAQNSSKRRSANSSSRARARAMGGFLFGSFLIVGYKGGLFFSPFSVDFSGEVMTPVVITSSFSGEVLSTVVSTSRFSGELLSTVDSTCGSSPSSIESSIFLAR